MAVHQEKQVYRHHGRSFVAVEKAVIADQGMKQGRCFIQDAWIKFAPSKSLKWAKDSRIDKRRIPSLVSTNWFAPRPMQRHEIIVNAFYE